ncbi:MAG: CaiB/BaiF CoA transferase family protein, partial [Solirubrobacteraceae bacterium]
AGSAAGGSPPEPAPGANARPEPAAAGGREPPLAGIHVLDISRVLAGPYAAMILGDLGAEVIKVERPEVGDDTRAWGPPFVGPEGRQESTYFLSANRNKRSITLDLKDSEDLRLLHRMLVWADVLVQNFRPGVMDRLGLTSDFLAEINPALIVLTITGFGSSGPERDRAAYDQILQAEGGLMGVTGPEDGQPLRIGVPIADLTAGLFGVIGALAALHERARSNRGQTVETSLLAGQIGLHAFQGTRYLVAGEVPGPTGNHHPTVAPYGTFAAADGQLILAVGNEPTWERFAPLVGIDPQTPAYAGNRTRVANRARLRAAIEQRLGERSVADWIELFAAHGVPAGEVKALDRVYASEQVRDQGLVLEVSHSTLGDISLPGRPLRFDGSPLGAAMAPPVLGEHSTQLRASFDGGPDRSSRHAG